MFDNNITSAKQKVLEKVDEYVNSRGYLIAFFKIENDNGDLYSDIVCENWPAEENDYTIRLFLNNLRNIYMEQSGTPQANMQYGNNEDYLYMQLESQGEMKW